MMRIVTGACGSGNDLAIVAATVEAPAGLKQRPSPKATACGRAALPAMAILLCCEAIQIRCVCLVRRQPCVGKGKFGWRLREVRSFERYAAVIPADAGKGAEHAVGLGGGVG